MAKEEDVKQKVLEQAVGYIKKQFGEGAIMTLGNKASHQFISVIPTGALSLDIALGIGGFPRGRIVEVFGPESSGKTTLALHIVANAQKLGGSAAYIDAEHALDPNYAQKIGVDIDTLMLSQPDCGEEALNIVETLARSGAVDVIVIDSVAALVPRSELEGEIGDSHMGLQARMMSQALRKLASTLARSNTCALFINQIREKIGVFFGNPETTTGGRALKFYSSVRVDIRRIGGIKKDNREVGNRVKIKVVKNKMAPPFQIAECDILFNKGLSSESCILELALTAGMVKKSGAWLTYKDLRFQGKESFREELEQNQQLYREMEAAVKEKFSSHCSFLQQNGNQPPKETRGNSSVG